MTLLLKRNNTKCYEECRDARDLQYRRARTSTPRASFGRAPRSRPGQTAVPAIPLPESVGDYVVSAMRSTHRSHASAFTQGSD